MTDSAGELKPKLPMGLRDRAKRAKLRRITKAADTMFRDGGYEGTTLRAIASRAKVSLATVFLYFHDKRDLFMSCVTANLGAVEAAEAVTAGDSVSLLDHVMTLFSRRYEFWASRPEIARVAMREFSAPFVADGSNGPDHGQALRERLVANIATFIEAECRANQGAPEFDSELYAWLLVHIYLSEVRVWLNTPNPDPASGLKRLRQLCKVAIAGMAFRS